LAAFAAAGGIALVSLGEELGSDADPDDREWFVISSADAVIFRLLSGEAARPRLAPSRMAF
jgi:hypothetical protein